MKQRKYALVYQAGIANVFEVQCFNLSPYGRDAKRVLQQAFEPCEHFARGLAQAGHLVMTMGCNMAGDITEMQWTDNLDDLPFSNRFARIYQRKTLD